MTKAVYKVVDGGNKQKRQLSPAVTEKERVLGGNEREFIIFQGCVRSKRSRVTVLKLFTAIYMFY